MLRPDFRWTKACRMARLARFMWLFLMTLLVGVARVILLLKNRDAQSWRWWLGWGVPLLAASVALTLLIQDPEPRKFVGRVLMPLGLLWASLGLGVMIAMMLRRWWISGVLSAAFVLVTCSGSTWIGDHLLRHLEADIPRLPLTAVPEVHAVFTLGGGTSLNTLGEPQLGTSGDRLIVAAKLYRLGKTPLLISSGSGFPGIDGERDLARETAHIWRDLGVPRNAIEELPGPINTVQEIEAYRDLCRARGWTNVALVSSAWHLPRALRMCRTAGLTVTPIGADWRGNSTPLSALTLVPTGSGAATVQLGCWEILGSWMP